MARIRQHRATTPIPAMTHIVCEYEDTPASIDFDCWNDSITTSIFAYKVVCQRFSVSHHMQCEESAAGAFLSQLEKLDKNLEGSATLCSITGESALEISMCDRRRGRLLVSTKGQIAHTPYRRLSDESVIPGVPFGLVHTVAGITMDQTGLSSLTSTIRMRKYRDQVCATFSEIAS